MSARLRRRRPRQFTCPFRAALRDALHYGSITAAIHAAMFVYLVNPSVNTLCRRPLRWLGGYQNRDHGWLSSYRYRADR